MEKNWWHGKVAYQIYPRSFKDSNGDGIGDLKGIISKLDYLSDLGIDIVWLSPIYPSPFVDNGYDISDYRNIASVFGTLDDFKELLSKARERNISIILDLVVNHCSSEHELFKKALQDPSGEEGSYFYFEKGRDGHEPDNLRSYFGGSVWEKVPGHDDLYYLHYFAKEQPDFNWTNPRLREKVYDMVNFWLGMGVAGFRIDAIMNLVKDPSFPGLPPDDTDGRCACNKMTNALLGKTIPLLKELKAHTFDKCNALTVAEAFGVSDEVLPMLYGDEGCFSTLFDFAARQPYELLPGYYAFFKSTVNNYRDANFATQKKVQDSGFICPILENHDEPRSLSFYFEKGEQTPETAKALATAFMFLRGLPFIFQGQELGMTNTHFDSLEEFDDLLAKDEYQKCLSHGLSAERALQILNEQSRDHGRTPMLWDDSENAGFSSHRPWLKVHQDYKALNARAQASDPCSVLNAYRRLIALRKDERFARIFTYGTFEALLEHEDRIIAYKRTLEGRSLAVFANFRASEYQVPQSGAREVVYATSPRSGLVDGTLKLAPYSACVCLP
ncbi:MAG: alpha-glucosidase [Succinivibrionaceae bacterium]|nr:alpha-glucosidase [Succinivibrionaceae bacterium]